MDRLRPFSWELRTIGGTGTLYLPLLLVAPWIMSDVMDGNETLKDYLWDSGGILLPHPEPQ